MKELEQKSSNEGVQAKELKQRSSSKGGVCTLCNRALRMALKEHSKESRGVLGQASKQAGKGKELSREGRRLAREGRK